MRSWDDNFHFHQGVTATPRANSSCVTLSLNESFNSNIISSSDSVTTQLASLMMIDSNSSKKRKRKGSMDVTNFEDDTMMCSFLENLLQPNSNSTLNTAPQVNKNKSKRTKRSSAADMLTVVLPQTPVASTNSLTRNTTNSLTYCNNNHSQTKYQMSVSYSTSFLK